MTYSCVKKHRVASNALKTVNLCLRVDEVIADCIPDTRVTCLIIFITVFFVIPKVITIIISLGLTPNQ